MDQIDYIKERLAPADLKLCDAKRLLDKEETQLLRKTHRSDQLDGHSVKARH